MLFFFKTSIQDSDLRKCGIRLDPQMVSDPTVACKAAGHPDFVCASNHPETGLEKALGAASHQDVL